MKESLVDIQRISSKLSNIIFKWFYGFSITWISKLTSSYSPSLSISLLYSTVPRSLKPPPAPVRSSSLPCFGAWHKLQSPRLWNEITNSATENVNFPKLPKEMILKFQNWQTGPQCAQRDIIGRVSYLAQLTLPQVAHCQSSALNKPLLFSAKCFPICIPPGLVLPPIIGRARGGWQIK